MPFSAKVNNGFEGETVAAVGISEVRMPLCDDPEQNKDIVLNTIKKILNEGDNVFRLEVDASSTVTVYSYCEKDDD